MNKLLIDDLIHDNPKGHIIVSKATDDKIEGETRIKKATYDFLYVQCCHSFSNRIEAITRLGYERDRITEDSFMKISGHVVQQPKNNEIQGFRRVDSPGEHEIINYSVFDSTNPSKRKTSQSTNRSLTIYSLTVQFD